MSLKSILLFLCLTSLSTSAPLSKRAFSDGPVITANFPDPTYINVGGTYYVFSTTSGHRNVPTYSSTDFVTWTAGADALPTIPSWSTGSIWAPDVIQLPDRTFVMYFAAVSSQDISKHCVGTATSSSVRGPYTPSTTSFACPLQSGGAIDPAGFADSNGDLYVVYKIDGSNLGGGGICGNADGSHPTPIMLQKVAADGVTPKGGAQKILDRGAADGPLIEAPSLVRSSGTYVLFFSSNCFNGPYYDTSYATASAIGGPYTKASSPLFVNGGDGGKLNSPGGAMVGPDGTKMVFHADSVSDNAGVRQMWTAGISISGTSVTIS